MIFELNIGRVQSTRFDTAGTRLISPSRIAAALRDRLPACLTQTYHQTTLSEPTVYAVVTTSCARDTVRHIVACLAGLLRQDCISIRWADGTGELVGPYASAWPAFDNKYFRDPTTEGVPC